MEFFESKTFSRIIFQMGQPADAKYFFSERLFSFLGSNNFFIFFFQSTFLSTLQNHRENQRTPQKKSFLGLKKTYFFQIGNQKTFLFLFSFFNHQNLRGFRKKVKFHSKTFSSFSPQKKKEKLIMKHTVLCCGWWWRAGGCCSKAGLMFLIPWDGVVCGSCWGDSYRALR